MSGRLDCRLTSAQMRGLAAWLSVQADDLDAGAVRDHSGRIEWATSPTALEVFVAAENAIVWGPPPRAQISIRVDGNAAEPAELEPDRPGL